MKFKHPIKLYIFKDRDIADVSIKVTDSYVVTYHFSVNTLQDILREWKNPNGGFECKFKDDQYGITVQYKQRGPRPERAEASYVRWSIWKNGITHNHRLEYDDMLYLERETFFQLNNKMHWDE